MDAENKASLIDPFITKYSFRQIVQFIMLPNLSYMIYRRLKLIEKVFLYYIRLIIIKTFNNVGADNVFTMNKLVLSTDLLNVRKDIGPVRSSSQIYEQQRKLTILKESYIY